MSRSPARDARVRGLLLIAVLTALAYVVGVHWWFTAPMLEMGEQIETLRQSELELRMESRQRAEIEKRIAQVQQFEAANPGFLPEANKELATAGLVQRLEQVVQAASPRPDACQITARTPADAVAGKEPYPRVVVQVRLRCGMGELAAVLHALESGSPQLFVDNLDVLSRRSYLAAGSEGGALDVSFDLFGYLAPGTLAVPHA
ncbi:MAG: type II secretion system protein GspM [Arenimonas sp.]